MKWQGKFYHNNNNKPSSLSMWDRRTGREVYPLSNVISRLGYSLFKKDGLITPWNEVMIYLGILIV